jgi:hypothetical protein
MSMKRALQIILLISLIGIAFSGTLTYRELCGAAGGGCSATSGGTLWGLPVCVYGLGMYLVVGVVAALGLAGGSRR